MLNFKKITKNWIMALIWPRPIIGLFFIPKLFLHWFKFSRIKGAPKIKLSDLQPCLGDWTTNTPFDAHYFYQGAWLARKLKSTGASDHVDIASSVLSISVLSGFVDTTFVDYRPLKTSLSGLKSIPGDILNLPFSDSIIQSLSCMHVIEHIGLGRYGDPLDPLGSVKAALQLQRVLNHGGNFFLTVPVGRERICFNAHRVFAPQTIINMFSDLSLVDFAFVDDQGVYHENANPNEALTLDYGCGMFFFKKIST